MTLLINLLMLIGGIVLLIKGSDWFVDGASDIAKALRIPSLVIGLTIVAFGTSAPEAAVSISASLTGVGEVAIGNVVGSNIFNLLMVVGISSCIRKIYVEKSVIVRDYPFNILITVVMLVMGLDVVLDNGAANVLSRIDGIVLLCFFAVFMYYTVAGALNDRQDMTEEAPERKMLLSITFLIVGIICVVAGGKLTVDGASGIARFFNVSENMIALTIIAIGTSLPELVTSVTALRKGEADIAIGNVIGSNLFNILFIAGMSALIRPVAVRGDSVADALILSVVNLIVYALMLKNKATGRAWSFYDSDVCVVCRVCCYERHSIKNRQKDVAPFGDFLNFCALRKLVAY